jgi:hypothetical protein
MRLSGSKYSDACWPVALPEPEGPTITAAELLIIRSAAMASPNVAPANPAATRKFT